MTFRPRLATSLMASLSSLMECVLLTKTTPYLVTFYGPPRRIAFTRVLPQLE
jgi:hypothetical protein